MNIIHTITKGQKISEGNCGVLNFPKKKTENISPNSALASKN